MKNQNLKKNTLGVTLYFEATDIYELPLKIVPPMLLFSETISFDNSPEGGREGGREQPWERRLIVNLVLRDETRCVSCEMESRDV